MQLKITVLEALTKPKKDGGTYTLLQCFSQIGGHTQVFQMFPPTKDQKIDRGDYMVTFEPVVDRDFRLGARAISLAPVSK